MKPIGFQPLLVPFIGLASASLLAAGCYESAERENHDGSTPDLYVSDHPEEPVIAVCGNAIVEGSEECDDGNIDECDGCSSLCRWERAMQADSAPGARTAGPVPCQLCPFTIELWFRVDRAGEGLFSLYATPGYLSFGVSTEYYEMERGGSGGGGAFIPPLEPGSWHHLASVCSWSGTSWDNLTYLDGEQLGGGHGWSEIPQWTCDGPLTVASAFEAMYMPYPFIPGAVDDLRISSEGLYTPDEPFVPEQHLSVRPDTVALWQFNSDEGGIIRDLSGNGYDLVLVNGKLVADACHGR